MCVLLYSYRKFSEARYEQENFAMSSDLYLYDSSFFCDSFSPFSDSLSFEDILQTLSDNENKEVDQITSSLLCSSPPDHQMGNLSISQTPHFGNATYGNGFADFSDVKTEEFQKPLYSACDYSNSYSPSFGMCENGVKMMQKSFSSNCFEGNSEFLTQPRFDHLMELSNFYSQVLNSPENSSSDQMRRVCSTGDLQRIKTGQRLSCTSLSTERSLIEVVNSKVGKYSAEERKERIQRYRAKRGHRNFNKTIKYVCRKTLADNRPRIHGRFARNDEVADIHKPAHFVRYNNDDSSQCTDRTV